MKIIQIYLRMWYSVCMCKFSVKKISLVFSALFCASLIFAAGSNAGRDIGGTPVRLWNNIPSMKKYKSVMYYHPAKIDASSAGDTNDVPQSAPAVIICPGGSYHHLGLYNEGFKSAEWFTQRGVAAFTLRYRTAENGFHHPAMLQDLQRAIQLVRENAEAYGINPEKLGIIGYSAGGHLVTMGGAFWQSHDELEKIGIHHSVSLKPDFVIPVYPVVSMQDNIAHRWSRKSLLGKDRGQNQSQARKDEFSMELQIPSDMSPTYVVVCKDDNVVDYHNSLVLYDALKEKGINCHLEVYEWGKHGFGMLNGPFMKEFHWNETLWTWLKENQLL